MGANRNLRIREEKIWKVEFKGDYITPNKYKHNPGRKESIE